MNPPGSLVFLVDDDPSVRRGLTRLLLSADHSVEVFASAAEFLARAPHMGPSCLILDIRMPGLTGLELQEALAGQPRDEQIVFITGHADVPMSVHAMKAGAVDFLPKPFDNEALLRAVDRALARSAERRRQRTRARLFAIEIRCANASRVRSSSIRHCGPAQQTDRCGTRAHGKDNQGSSRTYDRETRRKVSC